MIRRLVSVAVVIAAVVGLLRLDSGADSPSTATVAEQPAFGRSERGSVWYCAGAPRDGEVVELVVANAASERMRARLSGFGATPVEAAPSLSLDVGPRGRTVVPVADVGAGLGGVVVELVGGQGVVEQRVASESATDVEACTPDASDRWYFPTADTELGASSRVTLLNPFPTDASVDITVAYEEGVRIPTGLRGVVVAGGTSRVVELGEFVQRRAQFTVAVRARAGRVAATLSQTGDGEGAGEGLIIQQGTATPARTWWFADGFGAADVSERYVVMNPDDEAVSVELAVFTGASEELLPEPFVLEIPPRRYAVVDLDKEARVPESGLRWVRISADGGAGVVAERLVTIVGAGGESAATDRPPVADGITASGGSAVLASEWMVASIGIEEGPTVLVVANPDPDAIAVVELEALRDGTAEALSEPVEVPPGSSLAIEVTAATGGSSAAPIVIRSSAPVVVDARLTSIGRRDVVVLGATPRAAAVSDPARAGDGG